MLLERYYDDTLAQATYLIGCERTGEAIVIDPNVLDAEAQPWVQHGLTLRYVTETHIHADFLSGARTMARNRDATLLLSAYGGADWSYKTAPEDTVRLI